MDNKLIDDCFSFGFNSNIIQYKERLKQLFQDYDVAIFMARKSICFFKALHYNDEFNLKKCLITSSRVLNMNTDWLQGKKIVLVDDVVYKGNTLSKAIEKLKANSISDYVIRIIACDKNFETPIDIESPYHLLKDSEIKQLCKSITKYINASMRPYNIDFPIFNGSITNDDYDTFKRKNLNRIYDVSNTTQNKYNIINIITDLSEYLEGFLEFANIDFHLEIIKMRMYYNSTDKKMRNIFIVPIVLFPEIDEQKIDGYFDNNFPDELHKILFNIDHEKEVKNKYIFLQYYLSYQLLEYAKTIMNEFSLFKKISYRECDQDILFPPDNNKVLYSVLQNDSKQTKNIHPKSTEKKSFSFSYFKINDLLVLFTEFLFETVENYKKNRDHCFSILEISRYLGQFYDEKIIESYLSLLIDVAIDSGFIVPKLKIDNNKILRMYRHGENSHLGYQQMCLFAYMLGEYSKLSESNVPKTEAEKLFVLFFRQCLTDGTFNNESEYGDGLFGIRYNRFGPVISDSKSKFVVHKSSSLIDKMQGINDDLKPLILLVKGERGIGYCAPQKYNSKLESTQEDIAKRFARLYNNLRIDFNDFVMKMTSSEKRLLHITTYQRFLTFKAIGNNVDNQYLSLIAELQLFTSTMPAFECYMDMKETEYIIEFSKVIDGIISGMNKYLVYRYNAPNGEYNKVKNRFLEHLRLSGEESKKNIYYLDSIVNVIQDREIPNPDEETTLIINEKIDFVFRLLFKIAKLYHRLLLSTITRNEEYIDRKIIERHQRPKKIRKQISELGSILRKASNKNIQNFIKNINQNQISTELRKCYDESLCIIQNAELYFTDGDPKKSLHYVQFALIIIDRVNKKFSCEDFREYECDSCAFPNTDYYFICEESGDIKKLLKKCLDVFGNTHFIIHLFNQKDWYYGLYPRNKILICVNFENYFSPKLIKKIDNTMPRRVYYFYHKESYDDIAMKEIKYSGQLEIEHPLFGLKEYSVM